MPSTLTPSHQGRFDSPRTLAEIVEAFAPLARSHPGSRFAAYHSWLRDFVDSKRPFAELDVQERAMVRHAMAECMEALDIHRALIGPPAIPNLQQEFRRIFDGDLIARASRHYIELPGCASQAQEIGDATSLEERVRLPIERLRDDDDPVAPETQSTEEAPRNAAFELWLACLFRRADLVPAKEEPDWVVPTECGRIAIAAKRIQSFSPLYKRLEEAAAQISRQVQGGHAVAGIVAVDLTLAYDLHRKHWVIRREVESEELDATLAHAMAEHRDRVCTALQDRRDVVAVLLQAKALVFVRETQRFVTVRPNLFATMTPIGHPLNDWAVRFAASTVTRRPQ